MGDSASQKLERWAASWRSRALKMIQLARRPSSPLRGLPDFLVVGTMRGGTTSLYHYLIGHPEIRRPLHKEVGYFSGPRERRLSWYRCNFPIELRRRSPSPPHHLTFEASPSYLFDPRAPLRAAAVVPAAKIIVLLRDPVERAFSHYRLMVSEGWEPLSFEEAVELEPERLAGLWRPGARGRGGSELDRELYSYLARGRYVEQLPRWTEAFGTERVLVLRSEDLYGEPAKVYDEVLEFLELSPWRPSSFSVRSFALTSTARRSELAPATRSRLVEHFAPYNSALYELLGRDMGWAS